MTETDEYPFANSPAAQMLSEALERARVEHGVSQRSLATEMGYKSSVYISHMALGRSPIPVERASDFATRLDMDEAVFLRAVLEQRFPDLNLSILADSAENSNTKSGQPWFLAELEALAGTPLDQLPTPKMAVVREVLGAANPAERWASPGEYSILRLFRQEAPELAKCGLSRPQNEALVRLLRQLIKAR